MNDSPCIIGSKPPRPRLDHHSKSINIPTGNNLGASHEIQNPSRGKNRRDRVLALQMSRNCGQISLGDACGESRLMLSCALRMAVQWRINIRRIYRDFVHIF
jgi:hypothetical protein